MTRTATSHGRWLAACAGVALLAVGATPTWGGPLSLRLGSRLRAAGRAECSFVRVAADPWTGRTLSTRGRLALEVPDRARLDFPSTGERVTLRGDGGEWLQPKLKQIVAFGPARAGAARRWWQLLIDGTAPGIDVTPRDGGRLVMHAGGGGGPDSASLDLDAAGLPTRLLVPDQAQQVEYRFTRWRFSPARGEAAFRQQAPTGFERVELP
jgi:hypothetical protein